MGIIRNRLCFAMLLLSSTCLGLVPLSHATSKTSDSPPVSELSDLVKMLEAHHIPVDTGLVTHAATRAVLLSVDPGASLLSAEDYAKALAAVAEGTQAVEDVLRGEEWAEGVHYIEPTHCVAGAGASIVQYFRRWSSVDGGSVILDLRGKGGDDLESVVEVASIFVPGTNEDLFAVCDVRGLATARYRAHPSDVRIGMPVAVLVDGETTGTSELLAAILKNCPGVILLGRPTKGDTRLRELLPLGNGMAVRVSTKRLTPVIVDLYDDNGVRPHIEVPVSTGSTPVGGASVSPFHFLRRDRKQSEHEQAQAKLLKMAGHDNVLRRSIHMLLGLAALGIDVDAK
jgi:hypothetical protein